MQPIKSGIYSINNIANGKVYIGSAVNIKNRWCAHLNLLNKGAHHSRKLQRAWDKYGKSSFEFEVIEYISDKSTLIEREQFFIDLHMSADVGYNVSKVAGSTLGRKMSDEQRKRLSESATGRKASYETKKKLSEKLRLRKGEKRPESTRLKISEKAKGRIVTEETKAKMSASHKSRTRTAEHAEKIAKANKARAGMKASEEAKKKMSESAKRRVRNQSNRGVDGRFYAFGAERGVVWSEREAA